MLTVLIYTEDDEYDAHVARRGAAYLLALQDIHEKARQWWKWDEREAVPTDEIREMIWDALNTHSVDIHSERP